MYSMTLRNEPNMTNTVNIGNKQKHLILLHRATVQRDLISVSLETADFPSFSNNFLAAPKTVEGPPRRDTPDLMDSLVLTDSVTLKIQTIIKQLIQTTNTKLTLICIQLCSVAKS